MDPEELRAYIKKLAIIGSFFALALLLFVLELRSVLVAYVIVVGILATLAILIQSGKGGGLASIGGLAGDSLLGARSATPIAKATAVLGALLLFVCMLTARLGEETGTPKPDGPAAQFDDGGATTEGGAPAESPADGGDSE